jgi:hypothetical protein
MVSFTDEKNSHIRSRSFFQNEILCLAEERSDGAIAKRYATMTSFRPSTFSSRVRTSPPSIDESDPPQPLQPSASPPMEIVATPSFRDRRNPLRYVIQLGRASKPDCRAGRLDLVFLFLSRRCGSPDPQPHLTTTQKLRASVIGSSGTLVNRTTRF